MKPALDKAALKQATSWVNEEAVKEWRKLSRQGGAGKLVAGLRSRVQRLIDDAQVPPTTIRFFRTQMKNMISIALSELPDVTCKPSRVTYALYDWLDERERDCAGALGVELVVPKRGPFGENVYRNYTIHEGSEQVDALVSVVRTVLSKAGYVA
mgnify:CR=1 FL=1